MKISLVLESHGVENVDDIIKIFMQFFTRLKAFGDATLILKSI